MKVLINVENEIHEILSRTDENGRLLQREKTNLEYKESFTRKNQYGCAKTMAGFANRSGGLILFGITDKPRKIVGVGQKFEDIQIEKFTDLLNSTFSPEINYDIGSIDINSMTIGYIYTYESSNKPIMALKQEDSEKISSGDIYYRYNARTEKIKFPELQKIIKEKEENTRSVLLKSFESIIKSGTTNIGIINYDKGSFQTPNGVDVTVDKNLIIKVLKKAKYIKEGQFNETSGKPVIKVTGEINLSEGETIPDIEPDIQYPYIQKQLSEKLSIKQHYVQALIHKFKINDDKKYHVEITTSNSSVTHKYSDLALQYLAEIINAHKDEPDFLQVASKEYYADIRR